MSARVLLQGRLGGMDFTPNALAGSRVLGSSRGCIYGRGREKQINDLHAPYIYMLAHIHTLPLRTLPGDTVHFHTPTSFSWKTGDFYKLC